MAFSNLSNPGSIVMAGNPVIIKGTSNITANQFPCVVASFTASTGYKEEYTFPLSSSGSFQFDFSGALCETFRQLRVAVMDTDKHPKHTPQVISYTVVLKEQYYNDGVVYTKEDTKHTFTSYAIPGALTDYERQKMSNENIASLLGSAKVLSRKPTDDVIAIKGLKHYIPYIIQNSVETSGYKLDYSMTKRDALGKQTIPVTNGVSRSVYVIENDGSFIPLIFWNRFGLLESAVGHSNPTYQHNLTTSQYAVSDATPDFHSISHQQSNTKLDNQTITINSGLVNRNWYEWWIAEVLTSPQVWIYLNGAWMQGTIVPDTSIKYDTTKGEALNVEFKVKLSVAGSIYNSFVE